MNYQGSGAQFLPSLVENNVPPKLLTRGIGSSEKYLANQLKLQIKLAKLRRSLKESDF
jgi:hypothetical protein